jgi:hypothetical protein
MNTHLVEHLEAQYIYRDYGGYIFKLPRNKDLTYQSVELQEYYYWSLAAEAYKQLIIDKSRTTNSPNSATQVAGWEILTSATINSTQLATNGQITSKYIELNNIKKTQRDKLIETALSQVFITKNQTNSNNPFQYIEQINLFPIT